MNYFDIRSSSIEEIKSFIVELGEKPFRAAQIFEWINAKFAQSYDEMTNLPKSLRALLIEKAPLTPIAIARKQVSSTNDASKYLFRFENNIIIDNGNFEKKSFCESVLMHYHHGNSVCVSSQFGCRMGCTFCASTIGGLERSLSAGEMAAQIYGISRDTGERVSNIVLMGCGEPFDNYDNVLRFVRLINDPKGANIGQRHITISTCGIVPKIYRFIEEGIQVRLAVSLHAPNDEMRRQTMPIARAYPYDELLAACREYGERAGRITFEYALIRGVNDAPEHARELAARLADIHCHVNLIPVNEVKESGYKASEQASVARFVKILEEGNIKTTVRRKLGTDIDAACGQLRRAELESIPTGTVK